MIFCAQFMLKATAKKIAKRYGALIDEASFQPTMPWMKRVLPHTQAPVIIVQDKKRVLKLMKFALLPSWAKEKRVKFATHNARLETIDVKPTWKQPFLNQRCIVPLTDFIEPIYEGEYAGKMVAFKQLDEEIMSAAGIWSRWISKTDGEVIDSFAVVTDEPPSFIDEMGHDRCPVFLKDDAFDAWLVNGKQDPKKLRHLLNEHRAQLEFDLAVDRDMKPGWEKRA